MTLPLALAPLPPTRVGHDRPATSQAWTVLRGSGPAGLSLDDRSLPEPTGTEVRVRIRAAALNHRDLMVAFGQSGAGDRTRIPLSDGAGEVVATGPDVTDFQVGDAVASVFFPDWTGGAATAANTARALAGAYEGVLAKEVVLPQQAWIAMPAHLDAVEAATLGCAGLTAWHALFGDAGLQPGDSVLLLGTGGVSIWALQLAKAAGLRVLVTSSSEEKLARARALGADATINYRLVPDWHLEVLRLTHGLGVDRVLEIGGPQTLPRSLAATRVGGTVAIIGRLTGSEPIAFEPAALFGGLKRMLGVMVGSRAMAADLARFVEQQAIHPVIDRVFDFDEAPQAYAHLASGDHFGKVVIRID